MSGIPASLYTAGDKRRLTEMLALSPDALPGGGNFHPEEDVLEFLAGEVLARGPGHIVSLGGGLGAVVLARAVTVAGQGRLWVVEDDLRRMTLTREMIERVGGAAELIDAELDAYDDHNLWYARHLMRRLPSRIDLLFIDGPGHFAGRAPRWPAGPELFGRIVPDGAIILDDGKRVKEKKALQAWAKDFPQLAPVKERKSGGAVVLRHT